LQNPKAKNPLTLTKYKAKVQRRLHEWKWHPHKYRLARCVIENHALL